MSEGVAELIGRQLELEALGRALGDVEREDGGSRAFAVVGEPGLGKTRLLAEVGERAVG